MVHIVQALNSWARDPPASASQMAGLYEWITMSTYGGGFDKTLSQFNESLFFVLLYWGLNLGHPWLIPPASVGPCTIS